MNTSTKICWTVITVALLACLFVALPYAVRESRNNFTKNGLTRCLTPRGYTEWVDKTTCIN